MECLEKSYICNSCRKSVSNIQHILKLLSVYDQSKIQYNIYKCNETKATGNKDSAESEVALKEEIYSNDLIKKEPVEMIPVPNDDQNDYFNYENFKLKNEEIDLKFECSDCDNNDTDQSTHEFEKVEKENEVNYLEKNKLEKVKKYNFLECEIDGITNQIKKHPSRDDVDSNKSTCQSEKHIENEVDFKHTFGTKKLIIKLNLDDDIAKKMFLVQNRLKDNVKNNSQIFNCQYCPYETHLKSNLIRHIKSHKNIKDFACTLCSKVFTQKSSLDYHLFHIHKCRDVRKKLYNCDQCSYESLKKSQLLCHKRKHDTLKLNLDDNIPKKKFLMQPRLKDNVKNNSQIFNCQYCPYETPQKANLIRHIKSHKNIKDFECTLCSKAFTQKSSLDYHLFHIHKRRDVRKKLYNCDQCSYESLKKSQLLRHKKKHGTLKLNLDDNIAKKMFLMQHRLKDNIKNDSQIFKCQYCPYETRLKANLIRHIKSHKNIKDFECTLCSKTFAQKSSLHFHLFRIHKCRDIRKKLYNCDHCSYECLTKKELLLHKTKHGITNGLLILKCYQCPFETYHKNSLVTHVKIHQNIKDFKCCYCLKEFSQKCHLDSHLLRIHKYEDIKE